MTTLEASRIAELSSDLEGDVLLPGSDEYESARKVWNAMIDKRPALIVRGAAVSDVVRAIHFAKANGLVLAARGGGHNIAGSAIAEDGLVLDLSRMRSVRVDPEMRCVTIEAGATLADLDAATQAHGLATPLGINSTTGVAGLTLGGGFGWLSRKHGMTIDNLESVEVVTAAGRVLRASADHHAELFWALRGGSGNFGVVTSFEFRLHPVGPDVLSGLIVYPATEVVSVLRQYREFAAQAPDELSVWAILRSAPPLPFLPERFHGQGIVALAVLYAGDPVQGERLIEPLYRFGTLAGAHVGVQPYAAWQQTFDPLLTPGARNYWKSHNLASLSDELFEVVRDAMENLPSPECEIFIAALGGAVTRTAPESTAYAHRDAQFVMNLHARWADAADDAHCIGWARDVFGRLAPHATGGVYVNFLTADEGDRVRAAYGGNYRRLTMAKLRYDPDNLFRSNQNIQPA
jgi:FAD/FMN-containing dehydrogenase